MPSLPTTRAAAPLAALGLVLGAPTAADAAGFYIAEQSVEGLGRAFTGETVVADDASALWFNPALAVDLGNSATVGLSIVTIDLTYTDRGSSRTFGAAGGLSVPNGGPPGNDPIDAQLIPNGHVTWTMPDGRTVLGLSVNAPFGIVVDYPADWFGRYDSITSDLKTINVQGTLARRITEWASIGVGVSVQNADAKLTNAVPNQLDPVAGQLPDGLVRVEGDDMAVGWNLGALIEPARGVRIGAHYRSRLEYRLKGELTFSGLLGPLAGLNGSQAAETPLKTPDIASLGAAYDVNDELTVFAQATWFGWSSFRSIDVIGQTAPLASTFVGYRDTTNYGGGLEWRASQRWTVRGGVNFDETPITAELRTTRVPDSDRVWYAAGTTWTATERMRVDASLAYLTYDDAELTRTDEFFAGTLGAIASTLDARLEGEAFVFGVGLSVALGG